MKKILNNNFVIICLIILYRILLDYIYVNYTYPSWSYTGFDNAEAMHSLIISWIVLSILTLTILPYFRNNNGFYPDIMILFFLMRVIPFTTLIRFINTPDRLSLLFLIYFFLTFLLTNNIKIKEKLLTKDSNSDHIMYMVFIFFAFLIVFISGYYTHFRLHFSFADVYDLRYEAREFNMPLIIKYLWAPATNILPLLFVYFFKKKKHIICYTIVFIIILNFSINGLKSSVFKLLICVAFMFTKEKDLKCYYLPLFMLLLVSTVVEKTLWDFQLLHDIFIRRVLFIPSLLDTYYYDYITQHGPMYWFRGGTPIQFIIGDVYYNSPDANCNNGLFSDAYMNLGILGCFVYPIIYAFFFRFCGSAFRGADKGLVFFSAIIISYTIEGSELTTGLFTHGLVLYCVIMYLISVRTFQNQKINQPQNEKYKKELSI